MNLGNKIRELRKSNNLTQEQLAASFKASSQVVPKWEKLGQNLNKPH